MKSHMEEFFDNYRRAIEEYDIDPKYLWNCDETMINLDDSQEKVCDVGGQAEIALEQRMTEHITLLLFISAVGTWTKPLAIFPL